MVCWFEKQSVGLLPDKAAQQFSSRPALIYRERQWSFVELSEEIDHVAKALISLGVQSGEKVAVWLANSPEWVFLMFAIAKVGAVIVPMNTRYRTDDFSYALDQSDSVALIFQDKSGPIDYLSMFRECGLGKSEDQGKSGTLRSVVVLGDNTDGLLGWADFIRGGDSCSDAQLAERAASVDPDAPLIIAYTSGTTGNPKGVVHTHSCIRNITDCASRINITFTDVLVNYLPLFHLFSYSHCSLMSMITGASQLLLPWFDPDDALSAISKHGGTVIYGFDTHYRELMNVAEHSSCNLTSLRLGILPAGQASSYDIVWRAQQELCPTVSCYGITEIWTAPLLSFLDSSVEQRCQSSGFPLPGYEVRVVDPESGVELEEEEHGELLIRGYTLTQGYYKNEAATAEITDDEGWLHTGDEAFIRRDGHVTFLGRLKDMLKVGGENVSPAEVEAHLLSNTDAKEVAVVGVPDSRLGEVPAVFIVNAKGREITQRDVDECCSGRIAGFKIPRYVFAADKLPMTETGKVQKRLLELEATRRVEEMSADA